MNDSMFARFQKTWKHRIPLKRQIGDKQMNKWFGNVRYRTPTKQWINLQHRITLHISNQQESATRRHARSTGYIHAESWMRKTGEQAVNTNSWHRRINCHQWKAEFTSSPIWWHEHYSVSNLEHIRRKVLQY